MTKIVYENKLSSHFQIDLKRISRCICCSVKNGVKFCWVEGATFADLCIVQSEMDNI
jgi:hypothetical protein